VTQVANVSFSVQRPTISEGTDGDELNPEFADFLRSLEQQKGGKSESSSGTVNQLFFVPHPHF